MLTLQLAWEKTTSNICFACGWLVGLLATDSMVWTVMCVLRLLHPRQNVFHNGTQHMPIFFRQVVSNGFVFVFRINQPACLSGDKMKTIIRKQILATRHSKNCCLLTSSDTGTQTDRQTDTHTSTGNTIWAFKEGDDDDYEKNFAHMDIQQQQQRGDQEKRRQLLMNRRTVAEEGGFAKKKWAKVRNTKKQQQQQQEKNEVNNSSNNFDVYRQTDREMLAWLDGYVRLQGGLWSITRHDNEVKATGTTTATTKRRV